MNELDVKYQGEAEIYLQGENALEPVNIQTSLMEYYVGCHTSNILVKDYRTASAEAAQLALSGEIQDDSFSDVFNQQAWVEIRSTEDQAEIEIYDSHESTTAPTLWLGVIHNGMMGAYDINWEIIKPLGGTNFAFAALVN